MSIEERPRINSVEATRADLGEDRTKPPWLEGSKSLPFSHLSSDEFEVLCFLLLKAENEIDSKYKEIFYYGKTRDRGRDIIAITHSGETILFQCKHHSQNVGLSDIRPELAKLAVYVFSKEIDNPDEARFLLSTDLTGEAIDLIRNQEKWKVCVEKELTRYLKESPSSDLLNFAKEWWPQPVHQNGIELTKRIICHEDLLEEFFSLQKVVIADIRDIGHLLANGEASNRRFLDDWLEKLSKKLAVRTELPSPYSLPNIPEYYVERSFLVKGLTDAAQRKRIIFIHGFPKIGKTLLISYWLRENLPEKDIFYFLPSEPETARHETSLALHLCQYAARITCDSSVTECLDPWTRAPFEVMKSVLGIIGNKGIYCLDDVHLLSSDILDQVIETFMSNAPDDALLIIISEGEQIPSALMKHEQDSAVIKVSGFSDEETREFLQQRGVEVCQLPDKTLDALHSATEGHPLILDILAADPTRFTPEGVAGMLLGWPSAMRGGRLKAQLRKGLEDGVLRSDSHRILFHRLAAIHGGIPLALVDEIAKLRPQVTLPRVVLEDLQGRAIESTGGQGFRVHVLFSDDEGKYLSEEKRREVWRTAGHFYCAPRDGVVQYYDLIRGILFLARAEAWEDSVSNLVTATASLIRSGEMPPDPLLFSVFGDVELLVGKIPPLQIISLYLVRLQVLATMEEEHLSRRTVSNLIWALKMPPAEGEDREAAAFTRGMAALAIGIKLLSYSPKEAVRWLRYAAGIVPKGVREDFPVPIEQMVLFAVPLVRPVEPELVIESIESMESQGAEDFRRDRGVFVALRTVMTGIYQDLSSDSPENLQAEKAIQKALALGDFLRSKGLAYGPALAASVAAHIRMDLLEDKKCALRTLDSVKVQALRDWPEARFVIFYSKAAILFSAGEYDLAKEAYDQALATIGGEPIAGTEISVGDAFLKRGLCQARQSLEAPILSDYLRAYRIFSKSGPGSSVYKLKALGEIALFHAHAERHKKALAALRACVVLLDRWREEIGGDAQNEPSFREAIFKTSHVAGWLGGMLGNLAREHIPYGQVFAEPGLGFFDRVISEISELSRPTSFSGAHIFLADGFDGVNEIPLALSHARTALETAKAECYSLFEWRALDQVARLASKQGNFEEGFAATFNLLPFFIHGELIRETISQDRWAHIDFATLGDQVDSDKQTDAERFIFHEYVTPILSQIYIAQTNDFSFGNCEAGIDFLERVWETQDRSVLRPDWWKALGTIARCIFEAHHHPDQFQDWKTRAVDALGEDSDPELVAWYRLLADFDPKEKDSRKLTGWHVVAVDKLTQSAPWAQEMLHPYAAKWGLYWQRVLSGEIGLDLPEDVVQPLGQLLDQFELAEDKISLMMRGLVVLVHSVNLNYDLINIVKFLLRKGVEDLPEKEAVSLFRISVEPVMQGINQAVLDGNLHMAEEYINTAKQRVNLFSSWLEELPKLKEHVDEIEQTLSSFSGDFSR